MFKSQVMWDKSLLLSSGLPMVPPLRCSPHTCRPVAGRVTVAVLKPFMCSQVGLLAITTASSPGQRASSTRRRWRRIGPLSGQCTPREWSPRLSTPSQRFDQTFGLPGSDCSGIRGRGHHERPLAGPIVAAQTGCFAGKSLKLLGQPHRAPQASGDRVRSWSAPRGNAISDTVGK